MTNPTNDTLGAVPEPPGHAYVLVTVALGDGTIDYGRRIATHRFATRTAAEAAAVWLGRHAETTIIEDREGPRT